MSANNKTNKNNKKQKNQKNQLILIKKQMVNKLKTFSISIHFTIAITRLCSTKQERKKKIEKHTTNNKNSTKLKGKNVRNQQTLTLTQANIHLKNRNLR